MPLSILYRCVIGVRRFLYRRGVLESGKAAIPVIVVGNITAGGTGKTPAVIWLVEQLRSRGWSPGIVSRGYGGSRAGSSMRVDEDSDAAVAGDEPVLLARRARCPVVVDANRLRATSMLAEDGVDVAVTDDGLQHYRLQRDVELCVMDGERGLGNGRLIPAGPLREGASRLDSVDAVLINGGDYQHEFAFRFALHTSQARRLNGNGERSLEEFAGHAVHAVAGIGNPGRFFEQLRAAGLDVIEHAFRDHAALRMTDVQFDDDLDVLMTEKDAVKLGGQVSDRFWFLPVEIEMDSAGAVTLMNRIEQELSDSENRDV